MPSRSVLSAVADLLGAVVVICDVGILHVEPPNSAAEGLVANGRDGVGSVEVLEGHTWDAVSPPAVIQPSSETGGPTSPASP